MRSVSTSPPPHPETEEFWRDYLTKGSPMERQGRRVFSHIPSSPRCRMCAAPFKGVGAPVMRMMGKQQSDKNPTMCMSCFTFLSTHHGGAEIEVTLLFADVRGSTSMAEGMSAGAFRAVLDRFYDAAADVVIAHDGSIDKFVGDELVALFFPMLAGDRHAARAIDAARALLRATGHVDPGGPWIPLGAGVHTGVAWVGAVGEGSHTQITAVGDNVNTTARLASAAAAGEILVTVAAAKVADLTDAGIEHRQLALKGKAQPTEVVVVRA
jgi:adenylate cyclase